MRTQEWEARKEVGQKGKRGCRGINRLGIEDIDRGIVGRKKTEGKGEGRRG